MSNKTETVVITLLFVFLFAMLAGVVGMSIKEFVVTKTYCHKHFQVEEDFDMCLFSKHYTRDKGE